MKKQQSLVLTAFIAIIVALYFSLGFHQSVSNNVRIDTVSHFIGFLALSFFSLYVLQIRILTTIIVLVIYAAATELGQAYLGFRNAQFSDFIADVLGVTMFALINWAHMVFKANK